MVLEEITMKTNKNRKIPNRVFITLEKVRESGMVNMFDRNGVLMLSGMYDHWADVWLDKFCGSHSNRNNYSIVLTQFSDYVQQKDLKQ